MSGALIELKDGRVVTAEEHVRILCEKHGLSGTKHIRRDPNDRERWIEYDADYEFTPVAEVSEEDRGWLNQLLSL